ncbi:VOC family protein [bacterium]|nr:VOC family protein [bacterium]MBU1653046.1 VOC family protein [bacterium]
MSEKEHSKPANGSVSWRDLTVPNADLVRDFYCKVVGWETEPVDMGGYRDYNMKDAAGNVVAGICHARGSIKNLPPQWLMYITVDNLDRSIAKCHELGGKLLTGPNDYGGMGRYAVVQDPAKAVVALYESA